MTRERDEALLPCPFCGHDAFMAPPNEDRDEWSIECAGYTRESRLVNCPGPTVEHAEKAVAMALWNRRVAAPQEGGPDVDDSTSMAQPSRSDSSGSDSLRVQVVEATVVPDNTSVAAAPVLAEALREIAEDLEGRRDAYDPTRREMCMSGTELRAWARRLRALAAQAQGPRFTYEKGRMISGAGGNWPVPDQLLPWIDELGAEIGRLLRPPRGAEGETL